MITLTLTEIIIRISIAVGLGALLGIERTLAGKTAGMRTYAMASLGSALFVIISQIFLSSIPNVNLSLENPLLMPSAVISGIGFICAGLVIFKENKLIGLTTAAGLWVSAGIGLASGFGFFNLAVVALVAALIIFTVLWFVEKLLKKFSYGSDEVE